MKARWIVALLLTAFTGVAAAQQGQVPTTETALGSVRIPRAVKADGKDLKAGTYQVRLRYREADCDVDVRSSITIDVAQVPVRETHRGQRCAPARTIDELYTRDGAAGVWRNEAEQGRGDTVGKKFYLSRTRVPEEMALLVRALLANGHRTQLLPRGEASVERGRQVTVRAGYTVFIAR